MSSSPKIDDALREAIISAPDVILDDSDVMQALIARNVIGDFRAPNLIRFGLTPLYIDEADVIGAVDILADVLDNRLWDDPAYKAKGRVT